MKCANCETTQGPFVRERLPGYPLCKDLDKCTQRRAKLDRERWEVKK